MTPVSSTPNVYDRSVSLGSDSAAVKGELIRSLVVELAGDTRQLEKLLTVINSLDSLKLSGWPTDVQKATELTTLMESAGMDLSKYYDRWPVTYYDPSTSLPVTQTFTSLTVTDRTYANAVLASGGSLLDGLYKNSATGDYFVVARYSSGLLSGLPFAFPLGTAPTPSITSPTAEELAGMTNDAQDLAESKTQTTQGKQVYMQDLISDQSRMLTFGTNNLQRKENLFLQIISHWG
jgi:hypothetical protein